MSEARRLRYVNQYAASVEPLPFDQPWARWQEKGVRNHARVGRNIRLLARSRWRSASSGSWRNRV